MSDQPPSAAASPPGSPTGYSGTPLLRKLGIKPHCRVALNRCAAPLCLVETIAALPAQTCDFPVAAGASVDIALLFARNAADLETSFAAAIPAVVTAGMIWVGWPKRSSGIATDLTDAEVRRIGLANGWVDIKVCAIDSVWSGLKFVRRLKNR